MIKIAFNATPLSSPLTGIGNYTNNLIKNMMLQDNFSFDMFYSKSWSGKILEPSNFISSPYVKSLIRRYIPNAYDVNRKLQQYYFSCGANKTNNDLYHEPNFLAFDFDGPIVITAHDLSWIRYPETHPKERVLAMNKHFESSLNRAQKIITDSEFVRSELVSVFGISEQKIIPVYLGVSSDFFPRSAHEISFFLDSLELSYGNYFLLVGTIEPRKNIKVVLSAFMMLPRKIRQQCPLVIVGMKGWHLDEFEDLVASLVISGEVRLLGYLPQKNLIEVISGALTLIYPSIYEGFGLPPLEAMACGVPVITSNSSSIPEVVGEAGLMVDPYDVDGFRSAMYQMIESGEFRNFYSELAIRRSFKFNWKDTAIKTTDVYREVLALS